MKKSLVLLLTSILLLVACSNSNPNQLQSWAYEVVTWNNQVYTMTNEVITEVESEIGAIKIHSTNESDDLPNLFSNKYQKGTKLFKIKDVEPIDYIAVLDNGSYYKAKKMKTAAD
ncbi:hypothetical protein [Paenibacillus endoradicis]|uniref:hypothetical protein n=1 Tax=Paenibacillus endoradicis TaxID=2972487 RepID=UPI0021595E19|nr:hypothetical protein [Paenibacillus endoradicis]MCR8656364.1 hypothetical protein [Paenibacillus endoradicis]